MVETELTIYRVAVTKKIKEKQINGLHYGNKGTFLKSIFCIIHRFLKKYFSEKGFWSRGCQSLKKCLSYCELVNYCYVKKITFTSDHTQNQIVILCSSCFWNFSMSILYTGLDFIWRLALYMRNKFNRIRKIHKFYIIPIHMCTCVYCKREICEQLIQCMRSGFKCTTHIHLFC